MVGEIPILEESVSVVALTLARIFPNLDYTEHVDENWKEVVDAICISGKIIHCSGKERHLYIPQSNFSDTSTEATLENGN